MDMMDMIHNVSYLIQMDMVDDTQYIVSDTHGYLIRMDMLDMMDMIHNVSYLKHIDMIHSVSIGVRHVCKCRKAICQNCILGTFFVLAVT